jgi:uncharacterized membrane protein
MLYLGRIPMPDLESQLNRWQAAGVIDSVTATRIRAYETAFQSDQKKPAGLRWQGIVALTLGAILLACGVVLFVNAHWDEIGPFARFTLVLSMISVFHLGGAICRTSFRGLSTTLHAVGTISTGAAIALVGQIFNIQEHWPAAILLWAIAALAGWALLRDEAQQTLTVLLFPAWLFCEWSYYAGNHHGGGVYLARMIGVWAILYLTFWLSSRRKVVWGLCFTAGTIGLIVAHVILLSGFEWSYGSYPFLAVKTRIWGWLLIVALPLLISLIRRRQSLIPVLAAIVVSSALPFCQTQASNTYWNGRANATYTHSTPSLAAHALVAALAIFLAWWGVRQASKPLVNYGIVAFAIAVAWFYFSDIFDKIGRSLGLIILGILFLAGGWALEKTRRRLIAHMRKPSLSSGEAI